MSTKERFQVSGFRRRVSGVRIHKTNDLEIEGFKDSGSIEFKRKKLIYVFNSQISVQYNAKHTCAPLDYFTGAQFVNN